jgi:acetoin utilization protein AcuC
LNATGSEVAVVVGERLARYGFGDGHPFGPDRHGAFLREFQQRGLDKQVQLLEPRDALIGELQLFHTPEHIRFVMERSQAGSGWLDGGDTPAFRGVFEAASCVVGASLTATEWILAGSHRRAFVPIGGLHHASRQRAAGFCVFNDCGVVIEHLRRDHGMARVAYVDVDAHHGDGVFYAFEDDPGLIFADLHESGQSLYPGTGADSEIGSGAAAGTKLNVPLPAGSGDAEFAAVWPQMLAHVARLRAGILHPAMRRRQHRRRSRSLTCNCPAPAMHARPRSVRAGRSPGSWPRAGVGRRRLRSRQSRAHLE